MSERKSLKTEGSCLISVGTYQCRKMKNGTIGIVTIGVLSGMPIMSIGEKKQKAKYACSLIRLGVVSQISYGRLSKTSFLLLRLTYQQTKRQDFSTQIQLMGES